MLTAGREQVSAGTVYDAVADFNLSGNNPLNGNAWAYGTEATIGGTFTPMAVFGNLGGQPVNNTYFYNQLPYGPAIGDNTTANTLNLGGSPNLLWPDNVLLIGPGGSSNPGTPEYAVVQWTAPATGLYNVNGFFENLQDANTDLYILANGTSIYSNVSSFDRAESGQDPQLFSASNLSLTQGETLQFLVGYNGDYDNSDDVVGLSATISPATSVTPEPASLTLFAMGIASMAGWRSRRRFLRRGVASRHC